MKILLLSLFMIISSSLFSQEQKPSLSKTDFENIETPDAKVKMFFYYLANNKKMSYEEEQFLLSSGKFGAELLRSAGYRDSLYRLVKEPEESLLWDRILGKRELFLPEDEEFIDSSLYFNSGYLRPVLASGDVSSKQAVALIVINRFRTTTNSGRKELYRSFLTLMFTPGMIKPRISLENSSLDGVSLANVLEESLARQDKNYHSEPPSSLRIEADSELVDSERRYIISGAGILGKHLAKRYPGNSTLIVVSPDYGENVRDKLIVSSLVACFDRGEEIKIAVLEESDGNLTRREAFDQLIGNNLDRQLFISLISLPREQDDLLRLNVWQSEKQVIALFLSEIYWLRPFIEDRRLIGAVIYKPGATFGDLSPKDQQAAFENRYLLVTPENLQKLSAEYPDLFPN